MNNILKFLVYIKSVNTELILNIKAELLTTYAWVLI